MSANQGLVNYRVISSMRVALRDGKTGLDGVPALVKRIIREDMWQSFAVSETGQVVQYARFADFAKTAPLEGLGADVDTLKRLCHEDMEALDLIDRVSKGRQGERTDLFDNIKEVSHTKDEPPTGTSRQHALRKLRKDAPELHAKVIAGDISPNAAMIKAGFRRKMVSIPTSDPTGAANAIIRNFNYDDLTTLINLLVEATQ